MEALKLPELASRWKDSAQPQVLRVDLNIPCQTGSLARFDNPSIPTVREAKLLAESPWVRSVGSLELRVTTEGWKFPSPLYDVPPKPKAVEEPKPRPEIRDDSVSRPRQ